MIYDCYSTRGRNGPRASIDMKKRNHSSVECRQFAYKLPNVLRL